MFLNIVQDVHRQFQPKTNVNESEEKHNARIFGGGWERF